MVSRTCTAYTLRFPPSRGIWGGHASRSRRGHAMPLSAGLRTVRQRSRGRGSTGQTGMPALLSGKGEGQLLWLLRNVCTPDTLVWQAIW